MGGEYAGELVYEHVFFYLNVTEFLAYYILYLSLGGITPTLAPFPYIMLLQLLYSKRSHAVH